MDWITRIAKKSWLNELIGSGRMSFYDFNGEYMSNSHNSLNYNRFISSISFLEIELPLNFVAYNKASKTRPFFNSTRFFL